MEAHATASIGQWHRANGRIDEAVVAFDEALRLAEEIVERELLAEVLVWRAEAAMLQENLAHDPEKVKLLATRSTGLQGGYFMIAARALGLDCGPMSGFDSAGIDREFFAGTAIKTYFLCNLGYGVADSVRPRAARLGFDEAAKIL